MSIGNFSYARMSFYSFLGKILHEICGIENSSDDKFIDPIWDNINQELMNCYLDDFMDFLAGYDSYWKASDEELQTIMSREEGVTKVFLAHGCSHEEASKKARLVSFSCKFLYYGYYVAESVSCHNFGEPKPSLAMANSVESYIEEMAEFIIPDEIPINEVHKKNENDKDYRYSIIRDCLEYTRLSYYYNWLRSAGATGFLSTWRLRKTLQKLYQRHVSSLKEIERLSKHLGLEKNPKNEIGRKVMDREDNTYSMEEFATLPLRSAFYYQWPSRFR